MINSLIFATIETVAMVLISGMFATLLGMPLGVALYLTKANSLAPNHIWSKTLSMLVNIGRSIPFIILFIAMMPIIRFVLHKTIGIGPAIFALSIAAIPFIARVVETALEDVGKGLIEAGKSMGATNKQIIKHILLPEAKPSIIRGITLTLVNLVGFSAMTGFTGTGGLGAMAINHGYMRYDTNIILATVIIMIILVQLIQSSGDYFARKISHQKN